MYGDGLSVIICCYNSACRLPATLKHLAGQQLSAGTAWEVIVVDNASTDETAETAKAEWEKYGIPGVSFQVVAEEKPGLSHAREKGIRASVFRLVVFCDDDNWLSEDYLQIAYTAMSGDPAIAAVGGQSTAAADIPLPDWFEASKNNYAVGRQAEQSGDISWRKHLWGSGLVIRKDLYNKAFSNFPSMLTGRNGKVLSSGEDSEICMRFLLMGYRLHYLEALTFKHFIAADRLRCDYNTKLMEGFIRAHEVLRIYARFIDAPGLPPKDRFPATLRSLIKVLAARLTGTRRWNIFDEKLQIFMLTGYPFKSIPPQIRSIRRLSVHRKKHRLNDC
ncbi:glycosyltransferase [Mucilaginibacter angelicae]|uniref:Glycosyltransferase n=1 Tax=Mucilaginibacter angelicae TaxID=869718 RepID=A0ABV6L518_9SPHI